MPCERAGHANASYIFAGYSQTLAVQGVEPFISMELLTWRRGSTTVLVTNDSSLDLGLCSLCTKMQAGKRKKLAVD